mgnify:CR=1 FL=1
MYSFTVRTFEAEYHLQTTTSPAENGIRGIDEGFEHFRPFGCMLVKITRNNDNKNLVNSYLNLKEARANIMRAYVMVDSAKRTAQEMPSRLLHQSAVNLRFAYLIISQCEKDVLRQQRANDGIQVE